MGLATNSKEQQFRFHQTLQKVHREHLQLSMPIFLRLLWVPRLR